ncbi:hypothetical protein F5878DRAFT_608540 [Lentinula raphanica]|uniref:Uncharacterized protein n=1 Tax=Lentinula raphanica TaxID=153919 RepID=A0AA38UI20_9AGAR|nr:hypothetical protein F5880DRAFT_1524518 [Lentinula raphanica]KAJ3842144.1 hypothetical protein F5878DRAFT_608540 [Lentinula raphanica]
MSVRTVQTSFTSHSTSTVAMSMIANPHVLSAVDLNVAYPPGLEGYRADKALLSRGRSYSASSARNLYSNQASNGLTQSNSRSFNRSGNNKRYPQGMRLPTSSYNQSQNQSRRAAFSSSPSKSMKHENSLIGGPLYQRTPRFDPFGDSKDSLLSPSPIITTGSSRSSNASEPSYTHYYYYDYSTNRPTLAYADEKTPTANLTASTNFLLDTLLNGRRDTSRSPSPPQSVTPTPAPIVVQPIVEPLPKPRSPSPPHSTRPRASAISRPSSPVAQTTTPSQSTATASPSPPPIKVSKAQRDAIARIVANMLLNRADGVSRRGRRCNSSGYVKSNLSRVVTVE